MDLFDILAERLRVEEGFRPFPYRCSAGKLTIGIGRNIQDNPLTKAELKTLDITNQDQLMKRGVTLTEAKYLLMNSIEDVYEELTSKLDFFKHLNDVRKVILLDMAFNIGVPGLMKFKNTLAFIKAGEYEKAAANMMQSLWAKQVKGRADKLSTAMKTGSF